MIGECPSNEGGGLRRSSDAGDSRMLALHPVMYACWNVQYVPYSGAVCKTVRK